MKAKMVTASWRERTRREKEEAMTSCWHQNKLDGFFSLPSHPFSSSSPQTTALPLLGHMHPPFLAIMDEIRQGLSWLFQTSSKATCLVSGTGHAGELEFFLSSFFFFLFFPLFV